MKKKQKNLSIKEKLNELINSMLDEALAENVDLEKLVVKQNVAKTAIDYLSKVKVDLEGKDLSFLEEISERTELLKMGGIEDESTEEEE